LLARGGLYSALWSRQREVDAAEETLRRAGEGEEDYNLPDAAASPSAP
jgi:ATP-binding cassette subfamily B protein